MSIEAMKMALEALDQLQGGCTDSDDGTVEAITVWCPEVIDALRQAIEQAEQAQPVAWMYVNKDGECEQIEFGPIPDDPGATPLYTTPPPRQPLTDEEILKVWEQAMVQDNGAHARLDNQPFVHFARAIEAAHGIKGEA